MQIENNELKKQFNNLTIHYADLKADNAEKKRQLRSPSQRAANTDTNKKGRTSSKNEMSDTMIPLYAQRFGVMHEIFLDATHFQHLSDDAQAKFVDPYSKDQFENNESRAKGISVELYEVPREWHKHLREHPFVSQLASAFSNLV